MCSALRDMPNIYINFKRLKFFTYHPKIPLKKTFLFFFQMTTDDENLEVFSINNIFFLEKYLKYYFKIQLRFFLGFFFIHRVAHRYLNDF